jgi:hypothetical protein
MWLENLFSVEMTENLFDFTVQICFTVARKKMFTKHLKGNSEITCKS